MSSYTIRITTTMNVKNHDGSMMTGDVALMAASSLGGDVGAADRG